MSGERILDEAEQYNASSREQGHPGDYSYILIRPEWHHLTPDEQELISSSLRDQLDGSLLAEYEVHLTGEQAREMWSHVAGFSWSEEYYGLMSSLPSRVLVLKGAEKASQIKGIMREEYTFLIDQLPERLGVSFHPDIIHGSDPGKATNELGILGITYIEDKI